MGCPAFLRASSIHRRAFHCTTSMLLFHVMMKQEEALDLLEHSGGQLDCNAYVYLLRKCGNAKALAEGKRLHAQILKAGYDQETLVGNFIVQMYGSCASMVDAGEAFRRIRLPNVFSWNILLAAHTQNGQLQDAKALFDAIPQWNLVSWTTMMTAYAQNGYLEETRIMFEGLAECSVVAWNIMLSAYTHDAHLGRTGNSRKRLELFERMLLEGVQADKITFVTLLNGFTCLQGAKLVHSRIVSSGLELDITVATSLMTTYAKCGDLENARNIFSRMTKRDVIAWNTVMTAYARDGRVEDARNMFEKMPRRDVVSWNALIATNAELGHLEDAKALFDEMPETDVVCWTAMVAAYAQHGQLGVARGMFDEMPVRNVVSWTAMIAAYAKEELGKDALHLFKLMDLDGVQPNHITFTSIVNACAGLSALSEARLIHPEITTLGFISDLGIVTALVNMYGRCGSLEDARRAFDSLLQKDLVLWTAMISAYARDGYGKNALELFMEMNLEGLIPDRVTFTSILSACSHWGLADDGSIYFRFIYDYDDMIPTSNHYGCMVDLLGRAGKLEEAEDLINSMPFEPNIVAWMALLGACRVHSDMERGARATLRMFELNLMQIDGNQQGKSEMLQGNDSDMHLLALIS